MTEKKGRGTRRSERPPKSAAPTLLAQRDEFLQTFFKKGAQLTEEMSKENDRLRSEIGRLEAENAKLRTQLASDDAIRDLLKTIKRLETEKQQLLSKWDEAEEATSRFTSRFREIEAELENFANLYVASYQLHSSLRPPIVLRHLKELLQQLVGARAVAFYVVDRARAELVPIAADGMDVAALPVLGIARGEAALEGAAAIVERVFLTDVPYVKEGSVEDCGPASPAACVPMHVEDEVVGCIVVYALLPQKPEFVAVDYELFKLLGAHAGTALVAAELYAQTGEKAPALSALREH